LRGLAVRILVLTPAYTIHQRRWTAWTNRDEHGLRLTGAILFAQAGDMHVPGGEA